MIAKQTGRVSKTLGRIGLFTAIVLGTGNGDVIAQAAIDLCGCAGDPTLVDFNAGNPATYPPGTSGCSGPCTAGTITFTLPPDGVLKFKSFTANGQFNLRFTGNDANSPVTILVAGNVLLRSAFGCCHNLVISGSGGAPGFNGGAGVGGQGGPGGFRGGDASSEAHNLVTVGGAGGGPGGGAPATATAGAAGGTFFGVPELLPLLGGSGGGGGSGVTTGTNCTGGGGGGGGGALLFVANGSFTMHDYDMFADGGPGGNTANGGCGRGGAGGSGGAVRLVANNFVHIGTARVFIRGAGGGHTSGGGSSGLGRIESVDASAQVSINFEPATGLRINGPGPLRNAIAPEVNITAVDGRPVTPPAQGFRGLIDVTLDAPGETIVDFSTAGVPSGTTVAVVVKPRIGAGSQSQLVPLSACNGDGACTGAATFNLAAGVYTVEARATFQIP